MSDTIVTVQPQIQTLTSNQGQVLLVDNTSINIVTAGAAGLSGSIELSTQTTGILPISRGGTNASTEAGAVANLVQPLSWAGYPLINTNIKQVPFYDEEIGSSGFTYINDIEQQGAFDYDPLQKAIVSKTANYTVTRYDGTILVSCISGAVTITLPNATMMPSGAIFHVIKTDNSTNLLTLTTTSSQTINGSTTLVTNVRYTVFSVVSDGANWRLI